MMRRFLTCACGNPQVATINPVTAPPGRYMITAVDASPDEMVPDVPLLDLTAGLLAPIVECPRTAARAMAVPVELAARLDREIIRITEAAHDGIEILDIKGQYDLLCSAMERLSGYVPDSANPPTEDILDARDDFLTSLAHLKAAIHTAARLLRSTVEDLTRLTKDHALFNDEIGVLVDFIAGSAESGTTSPLRQKCTRIVDGVAGVAKVLVVLVELQKTSLALRFSHTHMGRAAARIGSGQGLEFDAADTAPGDAPHTVSQRLVAHTRQLLMGRDSLLVELAQLPAFEYIGDELVERTVGLVHPEFGTRFSGTSHTTVRQNVDYAKNHGIPPAVIGRFAVDHPLLLALPSWRFRFWVDQYCKYERLRPGLGVSSRPDFRDVPLFPLDLEDRVISATQSLFTRKAAVDGLIPVTLRNVLDRAAIQPASLDSSEGLSDRHYEIARQILLHGFVEYTPNGRRYEPVSPATIVRRIDKGTAGSLLIKEKECAPVLQVLVDRGLVLQVPGERKLKYFVLAIGGSPVADHRETLKDLTNLHREIELKKLLNRQDPLDISLPALTEVFSTDPAVLIARQEALRTLVARVKELITGRPDEKAFTVILAELLTPDVTIGRWTSYTTAPREASADAKASFASWKRLGADDQFKHSTQGWGEAFLQWWKTVTVNTFGNLTRTQQSIIDRLKQLKEVLRDEAIQFDELDEVTRAASDFVNDGSGRNFGMLILVSQKRREILASITRLERAVEDRERRYKDGQ